MLNMERQEGRHARGTTRSEHHERVETKVGLCAASGQSEGVCCRRIEAVFLVEGVSTTRSFYFPSGCTYNRVYAVPPIAPTIQCDPRPLERRREASRRRRLRLLVERRGIVFAGYLPVSLSGPVGIIVNGVGIGGQDSSPFWVTVYDNWHLREIMTSV